MDIINHPLSFLFILLTFFVYLIFSTLRRKFSKGPKCSYCNKGRMQLTKLEPRMINFSNVDGGGGAGEGGGSPNKSSVITKVTYQCANCKESITREENR